MYGLIGRIRAVPGQRDALASVLTEGTGGMPGCLSYVVANDPSDPDALWVTEVWDDQQSHRASLSLPSVQQAIARGRPLIAGFAERFETAPLGGQGLPTPPDAGDEAAVRALLDRVLAGWNALDGDAMAAPFAPDADVVGFDGSVMRGQGEVAATMKQVFADHKPGRWVTIVRDVRFPAPGVALLRTASGWIHDPAAESFPQAVQTLVAVKSGGEWRITLLQATPAEFHGRPELAEAMRAELRGAAAGG
ncbi:MAG TPA: SgcJ/EcaC family oxidoreductase [Longimicrobiales bacterium]|nr:SgcJ/EcaC family oxidoreductase [Longimicrobiales bacterium]